MTQEEKAKAYDEALERARIAHKDEDIHLKATLERIFPKLVESEDEMVRKEIISLVLKVMGREKDNLNDKNYEKMLDWLEKKGK